jgi:hypothetical protein
MTKGVQQHWQEAEVGVLKQQTAFAADGGTQRVLGVDMS